MDSQLSQLKSSADGVCQFKASPGMSGQPEARPLQWGPEGENSLIKNCLARTSWALPTLTPTIWTPWQVWSSRDICVRRQPFRNPPQHSTIVCNQLNFTARI